MFDKKSKNIIIFLIILILGFILFMIFNNNEITNIKINTNMIIIFPGESEKIEIVTDAKDVLWSSSDSNIAKVSDDGTVVGVDVGTAKIKASNSYSNDECIVKVIENEIERIEFEEFEYELVVGNEYNLIPIITPNKLQDKKLYWESSDENVATVNDGNIVGISNGEVTIKAIAGEKEAECTVKVVTLVEDFKLEQDSITVEVDEIKPIGTIFIPEDASNKEIIWESSDPTVASILNGEVNGVSVGNATITATTKDGNRESSCEITVIPKPKYTIKFTDSNKTVVIEKGSKLGNTPTPKKNGYIFLGWYTKKDGGNKIDSTTIIESNMTLYAHWKNSETYEQGPGSGIYSRTVTYMGRTFKDYKQTRITNLYNGGSIKERGCGPISLASVLSGYMNVNYMDVVAKTGLSTSFGQIGNAIDKYGLHHSGLYAYNSNDHNTAKVRERTNQGISELKSGHQLIALVSGAKYCQSHSCNGHNWVAYAKNNHFIAIIGVKKDNETVIVFNPLDGKEEDSKLYDIIAYFMPGGGKGFMVVYK